MSLREELVQRIAAGIKGFPQQPEEQDWDDLKKSLDNVQQRLVQIGEYVANNFYEALNLCLIRKTASPTWAGLR